MLNKYIVILLIIMYCSFFAEGEIILPKQEKVDIALAEFHRLKIKDPLEAEKFLRKAAEESYSNKEIRPTIIIRTAWQEYRHSQGWEWADSTAQSKAIDALLGMYVKNFEEPQSYGLTILEATTAIRYLDYCEAGFIPFALLRTVDILGNISAYTQEPDLQPYYDLLPFRINGENHKELQKQIQTKLNAFKADDWLYAGFRAICDKQPQKILNIIISRLQKIDPAGADALQGFYMEKRMPLNDQDYKQMIEFYNRSALKGNILGCCRYADFLLLSDPEKSLKILTPVEGHELFSVMMGTLIKGDALLRRDKTEDVLQAGYMLKDAMDNCYDNEQRKYAKKLYSKCLDKLTILELEELERGLDPDEITAADLSAIAIGYETVEGQEDKAMEYYLRAAQAGDMAAFCRVCLRLMEIGIAEENEETVISAANSMLMLAETPCLPFRFNAVSIILYGLNGKEPSKEDIVKAIGYYDDFRTKYYKDPQKCLYNDGHFFCIESLNNPDHLPKENQDINSFFFWYDDALKMYKYALKKESEGDYNEALRGYSKATDYGHPFGKWKKELMKRKMREKTNQ